MQTFDFLFTMFLGEMVLHHCDNLCATIQKKMTSAAERQQIAKLVVAMIRSTRDQEAFKFFWTKVLRFAESLSIEEPQSP